MADTCVSSTVFGFCLVLAIIFALASGSAGIWWLGTRKQRKLVEQAEKVQQERDALREKEIQVHATATQHYLQEVSHWRKEFERIQQESEGYRRALEAAGINVNRHSVLAGTTLAGSRPVSPELKNKDLPNLVSKLNFEKDD